MVTKCLLWCLTPSRQCLPCPLQEHWFEGGDHLNALPRLYDLPGLCQQAPWQCTKDASSSGGRDAGVAQVLWP